MPRRSVLFSPGDRPSLMRKAPAAGADVLVFDLEDAVAPERKTEAREAVVEVLSDPDYDPDAEVAVRVNPGDAGLDDVEAICVDHPPDALVVPKATSADDVTRVADAARAVGADCPIIAIVENAAGVLAAPEVAAADATTALIFGAEDFAADVGATRTDEGTEVLYARERVVVAAAAAGIDAIDTLHVDYRDDDGLRDDARFSRQLGYDGKLAIHPTQVPIINDAFSPDPEDVAWAKKVLRARDEADAEGRGVFGVDGEMIDAPLVKQAENILDRADESY
ncbi:MULTISPECIES: CoA ester lyase [Haloferax]|uniref:CoA ester lyase n=1 Tax=Haloferax marinum TaxID=2666143 RepID=A0A6A8G425_9EURY|nr:MULTISPECIES: CoA ester lyase [Haloferax]KAB1196328.1 CoA ester lyase [Haloferax sp. CBA1150]MRW95318.1 CoA ester lyase [Haloferax marinum]